MGQPVDVRDLDRARLGTRLQLLPVKGILPPSLVLLLARIEDIHPVVRPVNTGDFATPLANAEIVLAHDIAGLENHSQCAGGRHSEPPERASL